MNSYSSKQSYVISISWFMILMNNVGMNRKCKKNFEYFITLHLKGFIYVLIFLRVWIENSGHHWAKNLFFCCTIRHATSATVLYNSLLLLQNDKQTINHETVRFYHPIICICNLSIISTILISRISIKIYASIVH